MISDDMVLAFMEAYPPEGSILLAGRPFGSLEAHHMCRAGLMSDQRIDTPEHWQPCPCCQLVPDEL